jgi:hypothetical protein
MTITLLRPEQRWECPNCNLKEVTHESEPHSRFHSCRGLRGLTAPMVPEGTRCKVEAVEREDYVGKEQVQVDGYGRPVMSVVTTRDDGQDCAVLAPLVDLGIQSNGPMSIRSTNAYGGEDCRVMAPCAEITEGR